jgi:hypothetical protein
MLDSSFNIVEFIENNPVTKLSSNYHSKLLTKIKEKFTNEQQQMFVASFYCYLNYDSYNDFVIDLDDVWKWLCFSKKQKAKVLLEKQFIINKDYKKLLNLQVKQDAITHGGHNREIFMLNIDTFKKFCLKTGTQKADEIHDYFINLEKVLQEVIQEESNELKLQLEQKNIEYNNNIEKIEKEKQQIREKTLLEHFSNNVQCVYYGTIDNVSDKNEKLIKFGNSNNLKSRVKTHKDTYTNFRLINAFKVENKLQIENAIKENVFLTERFRVITIKNKKYVELLNAEGISFIELDKIIKDIITTIEYSPENYIKILEENKLLRMKLDEKATDDNTNSLAFLTIDNARLKNENIKIIKKFNQYKKIHKLQLNEEDVTPVNVEKEETNSYEKIVSLFTLNEGIVKNKDGTYSNNGKIYKSLFGSRKDVWDEIAYKTRGGLKKDDLIINVDGKVVSKKKSIYEKINYRLEKVNEAKKKK